MKDQLISFETAKLAKEKGFTEICNNSYVGIGILEEGLKLGNKWKRDYTFCTAPTQSLLQKWLREKNNPIVVQVNIEPIDDSEFAYVWYIRNYVPEGVEGTRKKDEADFWGYKSSFISHSGDWFKTYEEALEKGLQEALKLI